MPPLDLDLDLDLDLELKAFRACAATSKIFDEIMKEATEECDGQRLTLTPTLTLTLIGGV